MTNQTKLAMAAMLLVGTIATHAQQTPGAAGDSQSVVATTDGGGQTTTTPKKKTAAKKPVEKKNDVEEQLLREVRELREKQAAQQAQIDSLTQQNAAKDAALQQANATAAQAQQTAQSATAQTQAVTTTVQANTDAVKEIKSDIDNMQTVNAGVAATVSANKVELSDKIDSPAAIRYKGVTITPVAFFALEGVYRQRSVNSDINTPFNSIPFPSANEGHVSELNFSGRQSRLGGLFEGKAAGFKLSGYFESDFLGTGTSSNNNQSNSYVLRQRQFWGQAATDAGFTITGGQMWSLVTENGKGADNRTEKLPNTIDPQYMVGFSWTRQAAIRLQQRFGEYRTGALTLAASVEQAQITNFTANGTNPSQYFFAGVGQNGGLYNAAAGAGAGNTASTSAISTYANNVAPDFVVKFAYDNPKFHAELGGLARFLRDYYYPVTGYTGTAAAPTYTYAATYTSNTKAAGGVFGSVRGTVNKYLDLAVQGMAGQGVGRYGSAQLADATLRPDETLEPLRNYHGMASIESHPTPKLDIFAYYGGEYAQRTVYQTPQGSFIGYAPSNLSNAGCYNLPAAIGTAGSGGSLSAVTCGEPTKYIQEGMFGFTYRLVTSPRYGRLQYSATYQYLQRQLWTGIGSATTPTSPRAEDGMIHIGMRYYIP